MPSTGATAVDLPSAGNRPHPERVAEPPSWDGSGDAPDGRRRAARGVLVVLSDTARARELVDRACQECEDPRKRITIVGWSGSAVLIGLCSSHSFCLANAFEDSRMSMLRALDAACAFVPWEFEVTTECEDGLMRRAVRNRVASGDFSTIVATSRACSALSRGRSGRRLREFDIKLVPVGDERSSTTSAAASHISGPS